MAWTLKRAAISAFLIVHLAAVLVWTMPDCAIRRLGADWSACYLMPTGLWQQWGMFAPDPPRTTVTLEAVARDRRGLIHHFPFPRLSDKSVWQAAREFRHVKYAYKIGEKESVAMREFAARYVARRLALKEDDFPAVIQFLYQVEPSAGPGEPEPPAGPGQTVIETYSFPSLAETRP